MRIFKSHPLLKLVNSYLVDAPQPSNLSYLWNFGSLLALCLIIQIITGVTLAMHYNPSVLEAFNSIEHIMRDVNNGWLIRYLHSNTASAFFLIVYLHIGRGLYYGSYRAPRTLVWILGTVIFLLMIITGFLGYVLPFGQMSLWGATVITNLMSAIPWIGQDIVEFLWGGFSVNNATLNRFFALHFVLPFILAALALMHLIVLHDSAGSGNPIGISANYDRLPFAPYFIFKDLITIFIFIIGLSVFVFFMPNALGDSDNYIMGNPMQTPPAIVPEWYLLPFYAILRSIPNKLLGVIAMLSAILVLLAIPYIDLGRIRGLQFRPLSKIAFFIFVGNFLILLVLGTKHVESPFIEFGQISTFIYFAHFMFMIPLSLFENTLIELHIYNNSNVRVERILGKSSSKLTNSRQIRSFSTTRSRKVDPLSITALALQTLSMPNPAIGILSPALIAGAAVWLGMAFCCRDLLSDYLSFAAISEDLINNTVPYSNAIRDINQYKTGINAFLTLIDSQLSTASMEALKEMYTILQQLITVNETMYNHITTNLNTLSENKGVNIEIDSYNDIRLIGNRIVFLIRRIEDTLTLNNWITNRLPAFWFEA